MYFRENEFCAGKVSVVTPVYNGGILSGENAGFDTVANLF